MERDYVKEFEWFHSHPEVGFKEFETTERIKQILREENIEEIPFDLPTGALCIIRGNKKGNNRLLRADIDALPMEEKTELPYASVNKGVMHACGHDAHIVMGLMTADILNRNRDSVCGNVYVLFQPGEEVFDGARAVLGTKAVDDIDEFYAYHVNPAKETGVLELKEKGVTSSVDRFNISVTGTGAHAAMPHMAHNPIYTLSSMVEAIETRSGRRIDAFTPAVVSVTRINAGTTWNIIPERGEFEGTVRSLDEDARRQIKEEVEQIVRAYGMLDGVKAKIRWQEGSHIAYNDADLYLKSVKLARELGYRYDSGENIMIGDDFGDYAPYGSGKKSIYIRIGSGKGYTYHHPEFRVDPAVLGKGAFFMSRLIMSS